VILTVPAAASMAKETITSSPAVTAAVVVMDRDVPVIVAVAVPMLFWRPFAANADKVGIAANSIIKIMKIAAVL